MADDGTKFDDASHGVGTPLGCGPAVFHIVNVCIGSGILAMPLVLKEAGAAVGIGMIACVAVTTWISIHMLMRAADVSGGKGYSDVAKAAGGRGAYNVTRALVVFLTFATMVGIVVVARDLLPQIADSARGRHFGSDASDTTSSGGFAHLATSPNVLAAAMVALFMFPLSCLRSMHGLRFVSLASFAVVIAICATMTWSLFSGNVSPPPSSSSRDNGGLVLAKFRPMGFLRVLPLIFYAFGCHPQLVHVFSEARGRVSVSRFADVYFPLGGVICVLLYGWMGLVGYATYRNETQGNVLLNIPPSDVAVGIIVRSAMVLSVSCSFPLCMAACRHVLASLVFSPPRTQHEASPLLINGSDTSSESTDVDERTLTQVEHVCLTLGIVVLVYAVAVAAPNLQTVFGLAGATGAVVDEYCLPAYVYHRLVAKTMWQRTSAWLVGGVAAVVGIACTIAIISDTR